MCALSVSLTRLLYRYLQQVVTRRLYDGRTVHQPLHLTRHPAPLPCRPSQTPTDPSQHNPSFAPDFYQPNFFKEVEKRGVGDVLASGAASLAKNAQLAAEE